MVWGICNFSVKISFDWDNNLVIILNCLWLWELWIMGMILLFWEEWGGSIYDLEF